MHENINPSRTDPVFAGSTKEDPISAPSHYRSHPSGIECISVTEHMGFNLGNAVKYIWRADLKGNAAQDLKKAAWYIDREIKRRERCLAADKTMAAEASMTAVAELY